MSWRYRNRFRTAIGRSAVRRGRCIIVETAVAHWLTSANSSFYRELTAPARSSSADSSSTLKSVNARVFSSRLSILLPLTRFLHGPRPPRFHLCSIVRTNENDSHLPGMRVFDESLFLPPPTCLSYMMNLIIGAV